MKSTVPTLASVIAPPSSAHASGQRCAEAFAGMRVAFRRAVRMQRDRLHPGTYRLAGQSVLLRCVGDSLAQTVGRPFSHLHERSAVAPPSLTIEIWDERETGLSRRTFPPAAEVSAWQVGDATYWHSRDGRFIGHQMPHSHAWIDRTEGVIAGWVSAAGDIPWRERPKPLRLMLSVWAHHQGLHTIHAGLVARGGIGVLFAGAGGSGKSTCTLSCLRDRNLQYLGDDLVILQEHETGSFTGHSLYSSARLWHGHARRFPHLAAQALREDAAPDEKCIFLLARGFADRLGTAARIAAVVVPRPVGTGETRLSPLSKGRALLALAPSSVAACFPSSGAEGLAALGRLIERVPCFQLELGRDLAGIPPAVHAVFDQVNAATPPQAA